MVNPFRLVAGPEWVPERAREPGRVPVLGQVWAVQALELVWKVVVERRGQSLGLLPDKRWCTEAECDPRSQKE